MMAEKGSECNPIELLSDLSSESDSDGSLLEVKSEAGMKRMKTLSTSSLETSDDDDFLTCQYSSFSKLTSPIRKKQEKARADCVEYYSDRKDLPIFCRRDKHYSTKVTVETLLDPELDARYICTKQPVAVECNAVFLVDLRYLKKAKDILCDDLGSWKCNGNHSTWVVVNEDGVIDISGKEKPKCQEGVLYRVIKRYYNHKGSPDFHRLVVFLEDHDGDLLNLSLVHYSFDGEEHNILPRPHGNAKSRGAYIRTNPSTLCKLRETSQHLPPKHAVSEVSRSVGGVAGAVSVAELPRNRQQSYDCRRKLFSKKSSQFADPLLPVMIMCKESEGLNSDPSLRFVRIVTNSPEPMAVLAFERTLADLERFCTNPNEHVVLSVDPTFNLGSFNVTVTTYKHPMLEYKRKQGSHPVMLGPLFIHQRKTFATYNFFFSQLVGLRPALRNIQCYGTDGEKALQEALALHFRSATHLRCFLHFRGNVESKLSDLGISKSDAQEFVRDILGNPTQLEEGLVDADADKLDEEFESLKEKWDDRECFLTKNTDSCFHDWFRLNCLSVVKNNMLKDKRVLAGLGSPPEPFYTNDVESKNRVLKHQTSYNTQQLPSFVESMRKMFDDEREETERAVIGVGEYELCSPYKGLGMNSREWMKKNEKQRARVLRRFESAQLVDYRSHSPHSDSLAENTSTSCLSSNPSCSNPLHSTTLSDSIQMSMWAKVQSYMDDSSSYTNAPGVTDNSCILVKSQSSKKPHFVQKTGKSIYKCDKDCLMFKSTNGICSHSLLAATLNGEVDSFVSHYSKNRAPVNYANLAQHGLPVGGKKPSKRKSSAKKSTAAVKEILSASDYIERTKRTPLTSKSTSIVPAASSVADNGNSTAVFAPYANISTLTSNITLSNPPPLLHYSPGSPSVGELFYVVFLNARISRCQGCRGQIIHGLPSPHDIVLQHKEHVLFQNPNSGNWQLSKELRNTYYHATFQCVSKKHPNFTNSELKINPDVHKNLLLSHFSLLNTEFGVLY